MNLHIMASKHFDPDAKLPKLPDESWALSEEKKVINGCMFMLRAP